MVKERKKDIRKNRCGKGSNREGTRARRINASTPYDTCSEQLSPFGGLLALIKFFNLIDFREIFYSAYHQPSREPKLGHYSMLIGILMLLFIGFNRIWHFVYIRLDAMLCGFFRVTRLPAASTFWRYVDSLGINQAKSLLVVMSYLRERVWQFCGFEFYQIGVNMDTTVETVYGRQQGARKGHNPKGRGKKGYRPILCFIDETREYLCGKLRKGKTINGNQAADMIRGIKNYLPGCVQQVILRADGEFFGRQSVEAAIESGFQFIIVNRKSTPLFDEDQWYRPFKRKDIEFNSCYYQPGGWPEAYRFVAMRIPKDKEKASGMPVQCELFDSDRYTYRVFCTNISGKAHAVIAEYDKRADVENLVGEAKREGLDAIPSAKFKNNYAFFQIVMLAYNIWRYMKMITQKSITKGSSDTAGNGVFKGIVTNTVRIARLKLLFIAAKVVKESNRDKVKYSIHDARAPSMLHLLEYLDEARTRTRPWHQSGIWPQRYAIMS